MRKIILFVSILWTISVLGQTITGTPTHAYNLAGTTTSANFFNQAQAYKKFQFIYTNSELGNFATPISASVPITQLWFKHSGTSTPPATSLTNFKVLIGHSNTAPNTLDTNFNLNYSTAPLTCLNEPTFVYTVSGQWVGINLTTPFPYDGISNICIQIEYTASSNILAGNVISTTNQTLFANNVTAVKGALALNRPYIGFAAGPPCSVPSFALPNDSLVCGTNTITLNVPTNVNNTTLYTYQWIRKVLPTSPTGVNVGTGLTLTTLNTTATYVLVVSNIPFTCSKRDSITVTYSAAAPTFSLGPDKTFCAVNNTSPIQPIPLITPTGGLTFQWTGTTLPPSAPGPITGIPTPTAQTTTPPLAGQYVLTVSRGLCRTRDTIRITTPVPTFNLANDTTVCSGIPLTINAPAIIPTSPVPPGFTVAWFSHPFASFLPLTPIAGTSSITAPITNTDHYYVFVVSGPSACIKRDSIRVRYNSSSLTFTLIDDTFFCKTPNVIQLKPKVPIPTGGLTFSWSALDLVANTPVAMIPAPTNNQIYTPTTNAGRYILRVTDANGCVTRDTVKLFDRSVPVFDLMPFTLSKDTAVCTSSAAFAINVPLIVSTTPPYTYTWITHPFTSYTPNTIISGVNSILTNPTIFQRVYTLRVFNGFCFRTDSMRVTYDSVPLFSLGPDLTYCGTALNNTNPAAPNGVQLKPNPLISPVGTLTFQWTGTTIPPANPGPITGIPTPTAQTTTPPNPGQYILTVSKGLCRRRDTILLRPAVPTNIKLISKDTALCLGQTSLTIPVPTSVGASPPYTYSWYKYNTGAYAAGSIISTANVVTALAPAPPVPLGQFYTLTVSNGTCSRKDSIKVRFGGNSALFSLIPDTFYCGATNNVVLKPITPIIPPLTNPATVYTYQWTGTTIAPAVPGVNITGAALGTTPTLQTTTPPGPGQYVLTSLNVNSGCKYSDTVILRNRRIGAVTFADKDTSVCDASITSITLTAPTVPGTNLGNPYTYNWIQHPFASIVPSTSVSTLNTVVATNAFTNHWYVANVSNGFCVGRDSVRVRFGLPTPINLIKDTFYCSAPNNNVLLGPSVPLSTGVGTSFQWTGITILPDPAGINIVGGALGTPTVQNTTPTGSGQYTLSYINSAGCRSRDTVILRNRRVNKFDFNPKSVSLCNGEASYTINAPSIPPPAYGNAYTYTWSTYPFTGISPGTFVSNATTIVCPNTLPDNYYYLDVFNGFCRNTDSVRVRFGFPTPFTLGKDTFFCENSNTSLQAYAIYPTPAPLGITYQWTTFGPTVGIVPVSAATLIAITPQATSNYVLTNTNAAGCTFKDTVLVSKRYLAPINLGLDKLVCDNRYSNVIITKPTNVVVPQTWTWQYLNPNPSPIGTPNSTSLTATLPGDYILNYTNGFCKVTDTIRVTYADSTKFDLGPNRFFCTTINQDTLSPLIPLPKAPWPTKPWTYLWNGTQIGSATVIPLTPATNFSNTQNLLPTVPGNYRLTVTNDSGCISRDVIRLNNYKVTLGGTPPAPVLVTANPSGNPRDTILCNASTYAIRGPVLPAPVSPFTWSYKWYKKPNVNSANLLSSTQNYTASAAAAGSGEYILFVSNGFCNDTDKINIIFSSNPVVNLGKDDTLCSPFIKALSGPNAPNPTTTYLYNWTNQGSPIILANTQTYNTANPGTYILQVNNQFGCKKSDTIIVNARTIDPFVLGNDSGTCTPNSITIAGPPSLPSPNNYSYAWNTSPPTFVNPPTTNNLIAFNTGTYVLTIKNGPCIRKDSIKMEFLNQPIVVLPADIDICGKNLYNIAVQPTSIDNSLTYTWSDGNSGPINNITFDGTYVLTGSNKYCSASDNIKITSRLKPVLSSLGPDKEYCNNETFNLLLDPIVNYIPPSPFSISWKPGGQTTKSINVTTPGTYIVKVTNGANCEASDTVVIKSLQVPNLNIPESLFICGSGSFTVNASCNAQNYLWNTGSKDSILVIKEDGYYNVTASNGKCQATKNLFVDKLDKFTIGEDFDFCPENENPTIEISNRTDAFQWFKLGDNKFVDVEGKRKLVVKKPGIYYAAVTKGPCTLYDTINIKAFKNYNVFIPNSFSPSDNNSINPTYSIKATDVKDFDVKIFTRFGELLYQSSDVNFKWDGNTLKGKKVASGSYVYSISYKSFCSGEEVFSEKGILNVF